MSVLCKEYDILNFNEVFSARPPFNFSVLHINCQSLRNKFDSFSHFLSSLNVTFDIICVTETWLYDNELQFFRLDNYVFTGTQRDTRGGGAGAFVRCGLDVRECTVGGVAGADVHTVSLAVGGSSDQNNIKITIIYRQPSTDVNLFLHDLETILSSTPSTHHIITGDININIFCEQSCENYLNLISLYNFENIIDKPTHYSKSHNRWSCLDHILTNNKITQHEYIAGTIISDFSDHLPIFSFIKFDNSFGCTPEIPTTIESIDFHQLADLMDKAYWPTILSPNDVDTCYDNFLTELKLNLAECTKRVVLVKSKSKRSFKSKPWINRSIQNKITLKHRLYKQLCKSPLNTKLKNRYLIARNDVTSSLRTAKQQYFSSAFQNCKSSAQLWQIINNDLFGKPSKSKNFPTKLNSYNKPHIILTRLTDIANDLNSYFTSIGPELASKLPNVTDISLQLPDNSLNEAFSLIAVEEEDVLSILEQLDSKKAAGLDLVKPKVAKAIAKQICKPLQHIINKSMQFSKVPNKMKMARVTPIHKKGSESECANYRPISILPIFSKVMEKIVNNQILNYLESKNLFNKTQFGFRKNLGTSNALLEFSTQAYKAFNEGNAILGIFIDFSKAFDTIDHNILLIKLQQLNFSAQTINWIRDYLSNRTQQTKIDNALSSEKRITCGVSGTYTFFIYVNDLEKVFTHLKPIIYADDTSVFLQSKNLNNMMPDINSDLTKLNFRCIKKQTYNKH